MNGSSDSPIFDSSELFTFEERSGLGFQTVSRSKSLTGFKDILDHIKTIKPKMTIFEIKEKKTKNSDLSNAANVMRQLKSKNSHIIEKFKGILINKVF